MLPQVIDVLTTFPISNEITIFACLLDPAAHADELHVHCGRHTVFEEVTFDDGTKDYQIVLPRRRSVSEWRARRGRLAAAAAPAAVTEGVRKRKATPKREANATTKGSIAKKRRGRP